MNRKHIFINSANITDSQNDVHSEWRHTRHTPDFARTWSYRM